MDSTKDFRIVSTSDDGKVSIGPLIDIKVATFAAEMLNNRFGEGTHLAVSDEAAGKMAKGEIPGPAPLTAAGYRMREQMDPAPIASTGIKLNFAGLSDFAFAAELAKLGGLPKQSLYDGLTSSAVAGLLPRESVQAEASSNDWLREQFLTTPVPPGRPPIPEAAKAAVREALQLSVAEPVSALQGSEAAVESGSLPSAKLRSAGGYGIASLGEEKKKSSDVKPK